MLETSIQELKASVIELQASIDILTKAFANSAPTPKPAHVPKATPKATVNPANKGKTVTVVELDAPTEATLTAADLQKLFIETVKRDRDLKPAIKEILLSHGAATLPELDSSKFEDVAKAVSELAVKSV